MPEGLALFKALLLYNPWLAIPIWVIIYLSDYYLTIYGAQLYQRSRKQYIIYEEGYELAPALRKNIDALRLFSPGLFKVIAFSLIFLFLIWLVSLRLFDIPEFYFMIMGSFILPQVVIHLRHVRKICFFRIATSNNSLGITGPITYPKWVSLRLDAVEFFSGGALNSFMEGIKSYNLSNKS